MAQLLRSQQNEVLQRIQNVGLDPRSFEWDMVNGPSSRVQVSRLVHRPTGGYFVFDLNRGRHWTEFSPGHEVTVEQQFPGNWGLQLDYVTSWLQAVKREYEAPDLWRALSGESRLIDAASADAANEPFSDDEQKQVRGQLSELRSLADQADISPDSKATLEARLTYLEDAVGRQGRIDWANNLVGVLMGLALQAVVPPELVREMLALAWGGLGHLFGGGGFPALPS